MGGWVRAIGYIFSTGGLKNEGLTFYFKVELYPCIFLLSGVSRETRVMLTEYSRYPMLYVPRVNPPAKSKLIKHMLFAVAQSRNLPGHRCT